MEVNAAFSPAETPTHILGFQFNVFKTISGVAYSEVVTGFEIPWSSIPFLPVVHV